MSTILDALKKSEQERRLKKVPTLSDMPAPVEQSRWPRLLVLVLVVLVLVALVWLALLTVRSEDPAVPGRATVVELSNDSLAEQQAASSDFVVNVVSWSEQPEQRFVMIDGKLFRENEFVRAGLKVEQIRQNSVMLNQRGERIERRP